MKPAAFDYHRVDRVEDAVARLAELGEDAKVLAGGQSLVPMMNFRLVRPPALVDITRIPDLRYIGRDGDALRIGALTLHREIETLTDLEIVRGYELLPRAARWVGHYPIRTRGTFGGCASAAPSGARSQRRTATRSTTGRDRMPFSSRGCFRRVVSNGRL